ncbi:sialate O-acetylesterase [Marinagarivorans algicola]|uniref:sialate O-acetylesterase n=1 Tax=Marinagarivorans algicola TaxID=1513270 RepID=UPI003735543F
MKIINKILNITYLLAVVGLAGCGGNGGGSDKSTSSIQSSVKSTSISSFVKSSSPALSSFTASSSSINSSVQSSASSVALSGIAAEFDLSAVTYQKPSAQFILHSMISDNVVFQQQKIIRIAGQAEADTVILVKLASDVDSSQSHKALTVVPAGGEWEVTLPKLTASYDTYTLTVSDTVHEREVKNCLIGEVWVMAGQSNMELKVSQMTDGPVSTANIDEKNIRIFYQDVSNGNAEFPYEPQFDVLGGHWKVADSANHVADSSAIGLAFAQKARQSFIDQGKEVPVAIINAHRGGSKIQAWLPREVVKNSEEISAYVTSQPNTYINGKFFEVDNVDDWNNNSWDNYVQVSALFNRKLSPLTYFNIKGVAWYQGESDPVYEANVHNIKALIDSWSELFNRNDELLPFALIQLAPFNGRDPLAAEPVNYGGYHGFSDHRHAQLDIAQDEKYADSVQLVPIYDVALDWETTKEIFQFKDPIHPLAKRPVGERLADIVMSAFYLGDDKNIAPIYDTNESDVGDNSVTVTFNHVGTGLALFKDQSAGVATVEVVTRIGKRHTVAAEILPPNQIYIDATSLAALKLDVRDVSFISYSHYSRNENSNLAGSHGIPVLPFIAPTGNTGSDTLNDVVIFTDEITDWKLPADNTSVIETVVDDNPAYGKAIEYSYVKSKTVSPLRSSFVMNLSDYAGGTLEFDLKVMAEGAGIDGSWFMKVDCGYPCETGDVPLEMSNEGVKPTLGQWQRYTFDVDYLLGLPGRSDPGATPLDLAKVVSPLMVFPQWGDNQKNTVFRVDNIRYKPAGAEPTPLPQLVEDKVIFADAITDWALNANFSAHITEEVVDADDAVYGKVIRHTYIANQTASVIDSATAHDLSDYIGGTLSFDLLVEKTATGADGHWFIKVDCGWPCGTGDVPLTDSREGVLPSVGVWQRYTFDVNTLLAKPGGNDIGSMPLDIKNVIAPLVIFPTWGDNQEGTVFSIDNITYKPAGSSLPMTPPAPIADTVIFADALSVWRLPMSSAATITEEVVDAEQVSYGKVIEHTYTGNQTVSQFAAESAQSFRAYEGGTLSFDLRVVAAAPGADGNWYMKVDCGYPCETGDVPLTDSREGVMPTEGVWQRYTFNIDDLLAKPGRSDPPESTPLNIDAVIAPLVIFPTWGANQSGTIFQIDNIIYSQ